MMIRLAGCCKPAAGDQIVALAQLLIKRFPLGLFSVGYVPRGPLVDWQDGETTAALLDALHGEAWRHRAVFVKIEPPLLNSPVADCRLRQCGFQVSRYTNQPRATIVLDLSPGLNQVLAQMHQKTRYNIRYAARKEITIRVGGREDLAAFYRLMQATGRRAGFTPRSLDYYRCLWETFDPSQRIRLFAASYRGEILAFNVSAIFGEHAVFLHGASSDRHRNLQPNYLLMWKAIRWAKSQNCSTFDLWGIPDEVGQAVYEGEGLPVPDRTDGLWGVYRFKRGFSNTIKYYIGAYDCVYSLLLYRLITNRLFNQDVLDRIAVWMDWLKNP